MITKTKLVQSCNKDCKMSLNLTVFVNQRWKSHPILQELDLIFDFELCVHGYDQYVQDGLKLNKQVFHRATNVVQQANSSFDLKDDDDLMISSQSPLIKCGSPFYWSCEMTYTHSNSVYKNFTDIFTDNQSIASDAVKYLCVTTNLDLIPLPANVLLKSRFLSKIPIDMNVYNYLTTANGQITLHKNNNNQPLINLNSILWNDLDGAIFGYTLLLMNYCAKNDKELNEILWMTVVDTINTLFNNLETTEENKTRYLTGMTDRNCNFLFKTLGVIIDHLDAFMEQFETANKIDDWKLTLQDLSMAIHSLAFMEMLYNQNQEQLSIFHQTINKLITNCILNDSVPMQRTDLESKNIRLQLTKSTADRGLRQLFGVVDKNLNFITDPNEYGVNWYYHEDESWAWPWSFNLQSLFVHFPIVACNAILFILMGIITFYPLSLKMFKQTQLILNLIQDKIRSEKCEHINTCDLVQALLLKIKLKQLKMKQYPCDRIKTKNKIIKLLAELQPLYDYFSDMNIHHPCLYYIANELILIEFLAGKLSNLKDRLSKFGKVNFTPLSQHKRMFICRSLEKYHHLNVISCPKYLFQRFKIVFDECAVDGRKFKRMYTPINNKYKIRLTDIVFKLGFTIPSHNLQHSPSVKVDQHIYYFLKYLNCDKCCDNCLSRSKHLKVCRKCKHAWYCSKKCQKRARKSHCSFCQK